MSATFTLCLGATKKQDCGPGGPESVAVPLSEQTLGLQLVYTDQQNRRMRHAEPELNTAVARKAASIFITAT